MLPAILRAATVAARAGLPAVRNTNVATTAGQMVQHNPWAGLRVPNMNFGGGLANNGMAQISLLAGLADMADTVGGQPQIDGITGETVNDPIPRQHVDAFTGATRHVQTPVEGQANTVQTAPATVVTPDEVMRSFAGVQPDETLLPSYNPNVPQFSEFNYTPAEFKPLPTYNGNMAGGGDASVTGGLGLNMPTYQYKPQHQPQRQASRPTQATRPQPRARQGGGAYQGGLPPAGVMRPYTVAPTVSVQPTANGGTQFNLNQRTLQFANDPDYQRLYQLRAAQARQQAIQAGMDYDRMLAVARAGTPY